MNSERSSRGNVSSHSGGNVKIEMGESDQQQSGQASTKATKRGTAANDAGEVMCQACGIESMFVHEKMRPCSKCRAVVYCSQECKDWDWNSGGHNVKCTAVTTTNNNNDTIHKVEGEQSLTSQNSLDADNLFMPGSEIDLTGSPETSAQEDRMGRGSEDENEDEPTLESFLQNPGKSEQESVELHPAQIGLEDEDGSVSLSLDILNEQSAGHLGAIAEESFVSDGPVTEASWRRKVPFMKSQNKSKNFQQTIAETVLEEESEEESEEVSLMSNTDGDNAAPVTSIDTCSLLVEEDIALVELMDSKTSNEGSMFFDDGGSCDGGSGSSCAPADKDEPDRNQTSFNNSAPGSDSSEKSKLLLFREVYNSPQKQSESARGFFRVSSASSLKSFREAYNADNDDLSISSSSEHGTTSTGRRTTSYLGSLAVGEVDGSSSSGFDKEFAPERPETHSVLGTFESKPTEKNGSAIDRARHRVSQSKALLNEKLVGYEQRFGEEAAIAVLDDLKQKNNDSVENITDWRRLDSRNSDSKNSSKMESASKSLRVDHGSLDGSATSVYGSPDKHINEESISTDFLTGSSHRGVQRRLSSTQNCSVKSVQDESISIEFLATHAERNQPRSSQIPQYMQYRKSLVKQPSSAGGAEEFGNQEGEKLPPNQTAPRSCDSYRKMLCQPNTSGSESAQGTNVEYGYYRKMLSSKNHDVQNIRGELHNSSGSTQEQVNGTVSRYGCYRNSLSPLVETGARKSRQRDDNDENEVLCSDPYGGSVEFATAQLENYRADRRSLSASGDVSNVDEGVGRGNNANLIELNDDQPVNRISYETYRRSLPSQSESNEKHSPSLDVVESSLQSTGASPYDAYRKRLSSRKSPDESLIFQSEQERRIGDISYQSYRRALYSSNEVSSNHGMETKGSGSYESYRQSLSSRRDVSEKSSVALERVGIEHDKSDFDGTVSAYDIAEASTQKSDEEADSREREKTYTDYRRSLSSRDKKGYMDGGSASQTEVTAVESESLLNAPQPSYLAYRKSLSVSCQDPNAINVNDSAETHVSSPRGDTVYRNSLRNELEKSIISSGRRDEVESGSLGYEAYRRSLSSLTQHISQDFRGRGDQRRNSGPSDTNKETGLEGETPYCYTDYRKSLVLRGQRWKPEVGIGASGTTLRTFRQTPPGTESGYLTYRKSLRSDSIQSEVDYQREPHQRESDSDCVSRSALGYEAYRRTLSQNGSDREPSSNQGGLSNEGTSPNFAASIESERVGQLPPPKLAQSVNSGRISPNLIDKGILDSFGSSSSEGLPEVVTSPGNSASSVTSNSDNPAVAATRKKYSHMSKYLTYRLGLEIPDETVEGKQSVVPSDEEQQKQSLLSAELGDDSSANKSSAIHHIEVLEAAGFPRDMDWDLADVSSLFEVWNVVETDRIGAQEQKRMQQEHAQQQSSKQQSTQVPTQQQHVRFASQKDAKKPKPSKKRPLPPPEHFPSHDVETGTLPTTDAKWTLGRESGPHPALLCCRYILFLLLIILLPTAIGMGVRAARRQPPTESLAENTTESILSPMPTVLQETDKNRSPAPSPQRTETKESSSVETGSISELLDILYSVSIDSGTALRTPGTPQFLAYLWLLSDHDIVEKYSMNRIIQRYAMVTLFYSTDGERWTNKENWLTDEDECSWRMLSINPADACDAEGNVRIMDLSFNNLGGSLPPELGLLSHVEHLAVTGAGNSQAISGVLPETVGDMKKLTHLSVRGNSLVGPLPSELGGLDRLEVLDLGMNSFSLPLPAQVGGWKSLRVLNLELNDLTGSVPTEVNQLVNLEQLMLGSNRLTGVAEITGTLQSLRVLNLEENKLTSLSTRIGQLSSLETLTVYENDIFGLLPTELGNLMYLRRLNLHSNHIEGAIPTEIGQLKELVELNLSYNRFTGDIPLELGGITGLSRLELHSNELNGTVPKSLGQLSSLILIRLDDNNLSGQVPADVCDSFANFLPSFYLDCGDQLGGATTTPEVYCPSSSCCSFCCVDGQGCECAYDEENKWLCSFNR